MDQSGKTLGPQEGIPKPIKPEKPTEVETDSLTMANPPIEGEENPLVIQGEIPATPAVTALPAKEIIPAAEVSPQTHSRPITEGDVKPGSEILSTDQAAELIDAINSQPKASSVTELPGVLEENK